MTGKPMFLRLKSFFAVAAIVAAALCTTPPTHAADHDAVRQAVQRGEIRSLADILAIVRDKLPGEVAGVEIERKDGRWLYEFRAVDGKGRLFEVYVDAQSGVIERIKEK